jgi:competence protein ComEC
MASSWKLSHVVLLVGIVVLAGCAGVVPDDPTSADPSPNNESPTASVHGTVEIHYINVGQSVSTLVIGPDGETMLIDTGYYTDDGEYVLEYL